MVKWPPGSLSSPPWWHTCACTERQWRMSRANCLSAQVQSWCFMLNSRPGICIRPQPSNRCMSSLCTRGSGWGRQERFHRTSVRSGRAAMLLQQHVGDGADEAIPHHPHLSPGSKPDYRL